MSGSTTFGLCMQKISNIVMSSKIESRYVSLLNIKKIKFNIYMRSKLMKIFRVIFKLDLQCGAPFVHLLPVRLSSMKNICLIKINCIPITLKLWLGRERGLYHSSIQYMLPLKARILFESNHILQHDSIFPRYQEEQLNTCTGYLAQGI